ncbi:MAG: hypothetical protein FD146_556 [Anaerolineaceae bacterium]|nr:MAG: hypothetical protein FD146_556 [Anaerolineaceae bacterium]
MEKDKMIPASYNFLRQKAQSNQDFEFRELKAASGWTEENTRTNISKRLRQFLEEVSKDNYHVKKNILDVVYSEYYRLFKQSNIIVPQYNEHQHPDVVIFELFLPLTCEDKLRKALDKLFFKDTVLKRLQSIGMKELQEGFRKEDNETESGYLEGICKFFSDKFGGYSISHVSGRFRSKDLLERKKARELEDHDEDYLIDETTAIVRFVIPIQATEIVIRENSDIQLELNFSCPTVDEELTGIEWLFRNLLIAAILHTVDQNQIWILESGKRYQLYRFVDKNKE